MSFRHLSKSSYTTCFSSTGMRKDYSVYHGPRIITSLNHELDHVFPSLNKGYHQKACRTNKMIFLLLLFLSVSSSRAASSRGKFVLRKECEAGLLQRGQLKAENDAALESFLSLALTPMAAIKEEVWLRVRLLDVYSRPVYLLDLSQSADVGCWLSLRHVQTGEIIAKVLWPRDVLQSFTETLITMVLKGGVLRVTAVRRGAAPTDSILESQPPPFAASRHTTPLPVVGVLKTPHGGDTGAQRSGGPYLLLATLRRVHEAWQEPHSVGLEMMSTSATLYYAVNCDTDDLQWAWMDVLGVHSLTAAVWVPWLLVLLVAVMAVVVFTETRWRWCSRLRQNWQKKDKDGKPDESSRIRSPGAAPSSLSAPTVTVGRVSSRAPSPGLDLDQGEIREDTDKKAYTNFAYE